MGEQPKEYQCSWCKRNKFNGDESCPLDLEGTNGNSDIFDGVNRVIKSCGCGAFVDTRSRPAPASASENIELYVLKVLSDSREEILERLSSPFSPETIREMQEITRKHDAAISRKAREELLNAILDCAETDGEWFRIDGTDTLYLNYSVLSKKAESLRHHSEQAGDQHE